MVFQIRCAPKAAHCRPDSCTRHVSGKGLQGVPAVFHRVGVPSLARRSRWFLPRFAPTCSSLSLASCSWALSGGAPPPCCSLASRSPLRGGVSYAALLSRPSSFLTCKSPWRRRYPSPLLPDAPLQLMCAAPGAALPISLPWCPAGTECMLVSWFWL